MLIAVIILSALAILRGALAADGPDGFYYAWDTPSDSLPSLPSAGDSVTPIRTPSKQQSIQDIQTRALFNFSMLYELKVYPIDLEFRQTLIKRNREILFRFIDQYQQPIHRIGTLEGDIALSVYWWGFIVELSKPVKKFHCSVSLGQIAKNLRAQIYSLRLLVIKKDPSHTEAEYLGLAMLVESVVINNVRAVCDKAPNGQHVAALWSTPHMMHWFRKRVINRHESSAFSFSAEEMILGTIISKAAYDISNEDALVTLDKAVPLFPKVFSSPFVEVKKLDSGKITFGRTEETLVVGFRGTNSLNEWKFNFNGKQVERNISGKTYHFHQGFEKNFRRMRPFFYKFMYRFLQSMAAPGNKPLKAIIFAGHSMGGAMATYGTFEFFHDILPEMLSKSPALSRYLGSIANVRDKFHGIIVAAPPMGDVAFANLFESYKLNYYNFYSWSDKMPNLMYHWGGIGDRETNDSKLSKWEGAYWMRKMFSKVWKYKWKHVGIRIRTEDFVNPKFKFKKAAWRFLLPGWWSHAKNSHALESYLDNARKLLHITDFSSAVSTTLLYPGENFRLFSMKHQRYCVPNYQHGKKGKYRVECNASKETALSLPFVAVGVDEEGRVIEHDVNPISNCRSFALFSIQNGVQRAITADFEVNAQHYDENKGVQKFRSHLGFDKDGTRLCSHKNTELYGKALLLQRDVDKIGKVVLSSLVYLDFKGLTGLNQLYVEGSDVAIKVQNFWLAGRKEDVTAQFRIEMDDDLVVRPE